ncbi:MAG: type II toxin-antitoxin system VapC family toxin [Planktothrix sp. GU0601_MAG3]|nr:MAG: type II toxin-antitoxin system VapC family toxin [Planktothrix sp. GU0601_MAG3]
MSAFTKMIRYLLDTNVILRFCNPSDVQHHLATEAIFYLLNQGNECFLTGQVLIELWVVATRPVAVNGLGWTTEKTRNIIDELLNRFPLLEESPQIFLNWLDLVTTNQVMGKRTHDARLIAVMLANNITHILTFNPSDFGLKSRITVICPRQLVTP